RDEIHAIIGELGAEAGLDRALARLNERADLHALDGARVVHQTFGILGAGAGLFVDALGEETDAYAAGGANLEGGEEALEELEFPERLRLVELQAHACGTGAGGHEGGGEAEGSLGGGREAELARVG